MIWCTIYLLDNKGRSCKDCLFAQHKLLHYYILTHPQRHIWEALGNDETLQSMMGEIGNIINTRPLTYVPLENENESAITRNHFLVGSSNGLKPLALYRDDGVFVKESWLCSQQYDQ